MDKLGWEDLGGIVEWLYEQQKQGNQTFKVCDIRTAFKLTPPNTQTRLKRFIALGIIKKINLGYYEISQQLSPEKIQEIKEKYIPLGSLSRLYYFRGRWHTVEWIYQRYKPPMTLQYFAQRLNRGWSLTRALEIPIKKHKRELN